MQMRGIERKEMMGSLTAQIFSHLGDTFLTVRSEQSSLWARLAPRGSGEQRSVPEGLQCSSRAPTQQTPFKEQGREVGAASALEN